MNTIIHDIPVDKMDELHRFLETQLGSGISSGMISIIANADSLRSTAQGQIICDIEKNPGIRYILLATHIHKIVPRLLTQCKYLKYKLIS